MTTHLAVLLARDSAFNPEAIPADWHIDARVSGPVIDPALSALGYQLMSVEAFELHQATHRAAYDLWRTAKQSVPVEVDRWKLRAILKQTGHFAAIETVIASLPEPNQTVLREKWAGQETVARNHPTIIQLGAAIGLTAAQIDDIFRTAASLQ